MKKLIVLIAGAAMLAGLAGCDSTSEKTATTEDLLHHRFVLIQENGKEVPADKQAYIEFGEGLMINGKMCNRFFGKTTLTDGVLTSPGIASTKMLCADEQLNALDSTIGQIFKDGAKATLSDKNLTLTSGTTTLVYKLSDLVN
ncbi:META domain-containing protein [Zophobihabitans entericus]|uniref:META domain-containing protein n=1 Tax=Zophobihabitans entericus TaxID=1635327 RepID=A0A6G9IEH2_9GAMM|nr:META domain-containing protein [Zophobihabitans entericus]QIQ22094.1 META domain-containing protein [Zophobihabitans entericus]